MISESMPIKDSETDRCGKDPLEEGIVTNLPQVVEGAQAVPPHCSDPIVFWPGCDSGVASTLRPDEPAAGIDQAQPGVVRDVCD